MSELRQNFLAAARSLVGTPFRQHYNKNMPCVKGNLEDPRCLESGLNLHGEGYSCDGYNIGALCMARGIQVRRWPVTLRHMDQLARLGESRLPIAGDIILFCRGGFGAVHMGIYEGGDSVLHATDEGNRVLRDNIPLKETDEFISPEALAAAVDLGALAARSA